MPIRIQSLTQQKKIASKDAVEFYISLGEGIARSSKTVQYFSDGIEPNDRTDVPLCRWDVLSHSSDCYEEFVDDLELAKGTHIVEAIKKGAFDRNA